MKTMTVVSVLAVTLLTACASARLAEQKQKDDLARYQPYLGEPVTQFTRYSHDDGWTPVDNEHVLVHTNVKEAYLLRVAPPCINLPFAGVAIGVTEHYPHIVSSGFDSIRVRGETCRILEIRPVDYKRMEKDLAAEKKAGA